MESRESEAIKKAGSAPNEKRQTRPQCEPHVERPEMHRDFQGFALENEGIFYFGMPLAGCGELWYSDFVGIWHGCVDASWVVLPTQLIPARGRKPSSHGVDHAGNAGHNLSPQGNGNLPAATLRYLYLIDTTYPRRGTERAIRELPSTTL